ncbi:MAG: hypothetical protein ACKPFF_08915, partial [Planktothrix sp.]
MDFKRDNIYETCSEVFVMKIDNQGVIKWCNYYGGESCEEVNAIINTNDGGFILTGKTYSKEGNFN